MADRPQPPALRLEHMRQLHAFTNRKMKAIRARLEAAA